MAPGGTAGVAGPFRLRPLPLSELLDESFRLYRRHFVVFAVLSLALAIPGLLGGLLADSLLMRRTPPPFNADPANPAAVLSASADALGASAPLFAIELLLWPMTVGTLVRAATEVALGKRASIGGALRGTLLRYWGLYGVTLLVGAVALLAGAGYLVVLGILSVPLSFVALSLSPGIMSIIGAALAFSLVPFWLGLATRWSVAVPALLAEEIGPRAALRRSSELVRGRWWRTLGLLVLILLLLTALSLTVTYLFEGLVSFVPGMGDGGRFALQQAGALTNALIMPVFYIAWTLLYFDLRVRKEGLDLEFLAQRTGPASPGPS